MLMFTQEDLSRIKIDDGYKVVFLAPQMNEQERKSCVVYYRNIYNYFYDTSKEQKIFDENKLIRDVKIKGQPYTALLVRDVDDVEEMFAHATEVGFSLRRVNEEKMKIFKVMPDGRILDTSMMPIFKFNKMGRSDEENLQFILDKCNERFKNSYSFSIRHDKFNNVEVYYTKSMPRNFSFDYNRNSRMSLLIRIFYFEAEKWYTPSFFVSFGMEFLNEMGQDRGISLHDALYMNGESPRTSIKSKELKMPSEAVFEEINSKLQDGRGLFAVKPFRKDFEKAYMERIVKQSLLKVKKSFGYDKLSVDLYECNGDKYFAITCNKDDIKKLNDRSCTLHAMLLGNKHYRNVGDTFYYRDLEGSILPISCCHICKIDSKDVGEKIISGIVEKSVGKNRGYEIITEQGKGATDCFLKVVDDECYSAQSNSEFVRMKEKVQKCILGTLGPRVELQESDGSLKSNVVVSKDGKVMFSHAKSKDDTQAEAELPEIIDSAPQYVQERQ